MKKTLVLGVGNPLLSDDGIGTKVVRSLMEILDIGVFDFSEVYTCSLDLINIIQGYQNLVVIDGKMTPQGTPGEVSYSSVQNYSGMMHLDNYHDVSFLDLINLSMKLDLDIPKNIHIIAIEIVEDKIFINDLSLPLQRSYRDILETVKVLTEELSQNNIIPITNQS